MKLNITNIRNTLFLFLLLLIFFLLFYTFTNAIIVFDCIFTEPSYGDYFVNNERPVDPEDIKNRYYKAWKKIPMDGLLDVMPKPIYYEKENAKTFANLVLDFQNALANDIVNVTVEDSTGHKTTVHIMEDPINKEKSVVYIENNQGAKTMLRNVTISEKKEILQIDVLSFLKTLNSDDMYTFAYGTAWSCVILYVYRTRVYPTMLGDHPSLHDLTPWEEFAVNWGFNFPIYIATNTFLFSTDLVYWYYWGFPTGWWYTWGLTRNYVAIMEKPAMQLFIKMLRLSLGIDPWKII